MSRQTATQEKKKKIARLVNSVANQDAKVILVSVIKQSEANCATIVAGTSEVRMGGELEVARTALNEDVNDLKRDRKEADAVRVEYQTALGLLEAATAELDAGEPSRPTR